MRLALMGGLLCLNSILGWAESTSNASLEIAKIEKGTIVFSALPPIQTPYAELEALGRLTPSGGGVPFFLLSALPCDGCKEQKELFLVKADGSRREKFVFPGKVRDRKTGALLYEGRAFFGECLANRGPVYVSFQSDKMDRKRHLQPSVFVAEVDPNGDLQEKVIVRRRPSLSSTLQRVRKKGCQEISGFDRVSGDFPAIGPAQRRS